MFYLCIGYASIGLIILLRITLNTALTIEEHAIVVVITVFMDLFCVLPYLLGRKLASSPPLHWMSLLASGLLISVICVIILPEMGIAGPLGEWSDIVAGLLFFGVAFLPKEIEFWRPNTTGFPKQ